MVSGLDPLIFGFTIQASRSLNSPVSRQIPLDALVLPLAFATAAFWILAAYFLGRRSCISFAAADVCHQHPHQDYEFVQNSTEMQTSIQVQLWRSCFYLGAREWDAMAGGSLPFASGWLILSTTFISMTTTNGCR